jgi:two-component system LytT family response regulator
MIRAIIVDDEELARDEMRFLLEGEEVEIVGEAAGGREAVGLAAELSPDLVFLDIQMPEMNGFQVLQSLIETGKDIPLIIFATAYDQYAIKAFEYNALDYLLKPIDKERLRETLVRARRSLPKRKEYAERLRRLAENINVKTPFLPRIVIQRDRDIGLVESEKVAMLSKEGKLVRAYTSEGAFATNYPDLDEIEPQLDPRLFLRLGTNHIVNVRRISEIVPWSGGKYIIVLDDVDRTEVKLTRSQAMLLKNKVEGAS